jgi:hypothetical protein
MKSRFCRPSRAGDYADWEGLRGRSIRRLRRLRRFIDFIGFIRSRIPSALTFISSPMSSALRFIGSPIHRLSDSSVLGFIGSRIHRLPDSSALGFIQISVDRIRFPLRPPSSRRAHVDAPVFPPSTRLLSSTGHFQRLAQPMWKVDRERQMHLPSGTLRVRGCREATLASVLRIHNPVGAVRTWGRFCSLKRRAARK